MEDSKYAKNAIDYTLNLCLFAHCNHFILFPLGNFRSDSFSGIQNQGNVFVKCDCKSRFNSAEFCCQPVAGGAETDSNAKKTKMHEAIAHARDLSGRGYRSAKPSGYRKR